MGHLNKNWNACQKEKIIIKMQPEQTKLPEPDMAQVLLLSDREF